MAGLVTTCGILRLNFAYYGAEYYLVDLAYSRSIEI